MEDTMHLREIRARLRVSQWDLRQKTGIHQTKISLFEKGHIKLSDNERRRIAKALKVAINDIDWDTEATRGR
jgi:predicted transcriptional regulator